PGMRARVARFFAPGRDGVNTPYCPDCFVGRPVPRTSWVLWEGFPQEKCGRPLVCRFSFCAFDVAAKSFTLLASMSFVAEFSSLRVQSFAEQSLHADD